MVSYEEIEKRLAEAKQSHLLRFFSKLSDDEQNELLQQLDTIQFDGVTKLFERAMSSLKVTPNLLDGRMEPIPQSQFESEAQSSEDVLNKYRNEGLKRISNNEVAVLLMAGGQGTRLGVTYPKGMFSVDLPSGKTLFQIQAERIRRLQHLAEQKTGKAGRIPWYIMTSGPTHKATQKYLRANNYFGLNEEDVVLFRQGLLPCFDFEGAILLESPKSVALAPDGNGGIYRALAQNEILDDMTSRGINYVHVHSVDNILVKVADPIFIGYCVSKQADCGAKVVKKAGPSEAVGVVCQVDGRFQVVEYSEITEATANLKDQHGNLVFSAGNICNHFFTVPFLKQISDKHEHELKLHVAKKKIPHVNDDGEQVKPGAPNGIKIEKFVFDVFPFSTNFVTWEVQRNGEFSALKNSNDSGQDCPLTARRDLLSLHKDFVEASGGVVKGEVEISPLLSYDGENLEKVKGQVFEGTTVLAGDNESTSTVSIGGLDN